MNKITRKSFLKVLAATMVGGAAASALTGAAAPVSIDETNGKVSRWVKNSLNPDGPLTIAKQGMFSSGGTVTAPVAGTYDATTNWLDTTRAGNTAHVDHANVLYQIPADSNGWPMVYLHGYGQSRMGWITTPDGRQGWANLFLRNGYSAFLVDQPRRGEAGSTAQMSTDGFLDAWSADSKDYKPGDQAWYTHFRIGRVAPERYEGSQFPEGDAAQNQFFRQMTPDTGMDNAAGDQNIDNTVVAQAVAAAIDEIYDRTGQDSILVTHSQGGLPGWEVPLYTDHVAAIVAIEPGGAPQVDSEAYNAMVEQDIPVTFYYGDYIGEEFTDVPAAAMWSMMAASADTFTEAYNAAGGNSTVVYLPDEGITGNDHFMFQDLNNDVIADHIEAWIQENVA